jgi:hypothetical protein
MAKGSMAPLLLVGGGAAVLLLLLGKSSSSSSSSGSSAKKELPVGSGVPPGLDPAAYTRMQFATGDAAAKKIATLTPYQDYAREFAKTHGGMSPVQYNEAQLRASASAAQAADTASRGAYRAFADYQAEELARARADQAKAYDQQQTAGQMHEIDPSALFVPDGAPGSGGYVYKDPSGKCFARPWDGEDENEVVTVPTWLRPVDYRGGMIFTEAQITAAFDQLCALIGPGGWIRSAPLKGQVTRFI